ncbi:NAD(+) synthetase [Campylobacter sp. MIT 12-8780]|uniref:NAD+ synthase n=1 Tax=unclassified Campylobacter TaxID=2593542 RepID=UPI00115C95A7|nr:MULTISPECIES: NAD+ synthase [unclassified Campylobacter]NDJ27906.1 NAD+ synthase [Campylobacter sp. MIT 19-121]TQR40648.1 NAD(+) synthetase [Campylobacter sp. MIT 12-8780]
MDFAFLEKKLCKFIQDELENARVKGVVLGLSGGIDSALVATLCKKALGEKVFALLMPSQFSNETNLKDALKLCENLKLEYKIINIENILKAFLQNIQNPDKIRIGNLSARIRMSLLYDYSAFKNALVVGTSNKSELMLGYGTIYGDLACAFNPIARLYKSEIFEFAQFLGLDEVFIKKAPSADLYEGQSDEKELGFSYAQIDEALKALEANDKSTLTKLEPKLLEMIEKRKRQNAFKLELPRFISLDE